MRFLIPLVLSFVLLGCAKHECGCAPYQVYYIRARVSQTIDFSCGLPVLDFSEDSAHVQMITNKSDLFYSVVNLPAGYAVANKSLYVTISLLKPEEEFACNTMGIVYPHLKIRDAKSRD